MLCDHYRHWMQPIHPLEHVPVPCRLCANERFESVFLRYDVTQMQCSFCHCVQPPHASCQNPECTHYQKAHHYYCPVCFLWEHDPHKDIYHCEGCRICRVGTRAEYTHCAACQMCVPERHPHYCVGGLAKDNPCPVCYEDVSQSTEPSLFMGCGHCIHLHCKLDWLTHGGTVAQQHPCPLCKS